MAALTLLVLLAGSCMAPNLYDLQWLVVAAVALVSVAWQSRHAFRAPVLAMGVYLGLRAAWAAVDVPQPILSIVIVRQTAFLALLLAMTHYVRHEFADLLEWAVPLAAVSTLLGYPPLYQNTSMNGALLVAALPFAIHPVSVSLVILAVTFGQSGAAAFVMLPLWLLFTRSFWGWGLVPIGLGLGVKLWFNLHIFNESVRLKFWVATWAYFQEHVGQTFGTGLGTFLHYGRKVQAQFPDVRILTAASPHGENWRSLHNDWGQLLFETGWLGLALGVWLYADSLWNADHHTRVALFLVGFCSLVHFPMQAPLFAAFCVWLVVRAQER